MPATVTSLRICTLPLLFTRLSIESLPWYTWKSWAFRRPGPVTSTVSGPPAMA